MTRQILFSPSDLHSIQNNSGCVTVDCRFDLQNPDAGRRAYLDSHIPGAVYAHLEDDLSSPVTDISGRHPLPGADVFAAFLSRSGWRPGKLIVAYDDTGGAIAARLWWLMKYFGHDCAALLDGGLEHWGESGFGFESGPSDSVSTGSYASELNIQPDLVMSTRDVIDALNRRDRVLVDARTGERFAGESEPIDVKAGHIPGAVNYPYALNLNSNQTFRSVEDIRRDYQRFVKNHDVKGMVHMCGSGVTACLNIFAAELAGIGNSKLYAGSWSEWIRDPSRPISPKY